jgi:hypothetical protein
MCSSVVVVVVAVVVAVAALHKNFPADHIQLICWWA